MATLTEIAKKEKKTRKPAPKNGSRKPAAHNRKPVTGSKKPAARADYPFEAIAKAYNEGAGPMTIADQFKIYGEGPTGKYARISNILTALSKGVVVDGKTIKIERGKRTAPKKSAAA
jgi:hypothetical protein